MSWDPITRIIGNLGIYTKIDFANREVVECRSTSSLFRGYSVFMKGKDPRDARFITSRICGICGDNHATCSDLRPADGLRRQAAAARRLDHQPRRGRRVHVRPHDLPGQHGVRRLLRAHGQGDQPGPAEQGRADRGAPRRHPRLPDHRRHHARLQPLRGRGVQGGAADQPDHPRDVLPDGGPPRPPVHAVPRRRRHGRRRPQASPTTSSGCCTSSTSSNRPSP